MGGPLLGLDTSTSQASLALVHPASGQVLERTLEAASLPSEAVVAGIAELLESVDGQVQDVKALVVGLGPGSFTGLRVGLATAKGLAMGANVPLFGISSFALLALEAGPGQVLVACDARRGDYYCALYDVARDGFCRQVLAEQVMSLAALTRATQHALGEHHVAALTRLTVVGDARECVSHALGAGARHVAVRIAHGMVAAEQRIRAGTMDDLATLVPHYIRTSSVGR